MLGNRSMPASTVIPVLSYPDVGNAGFASEPTSYPYGERQYSCRDPGGHGWTFSQSIADIAPEDWRGIVEDVSGDRRGVHYD